MFDVDNVNPVKNQAGFFRVAHADKRLGNRLQYFNLIQIMWAFVDMCDVCGASESFLRQIRSTATELRGPKSLERIDQRIVQSVFNVLNNFYRGREVLYGRIVLPRAVLHDTKVV